MTALTRSPGQKKRRWSVLCRCLRVRLRFPTNAARVLRPRTTMNQSPLCDACASLKEAQDPKNSPRRKELSSQGICSSRCIKCNRKPEKTSPCNPSCAHTGRARSSKEARGTSQSTERRALNISSSGIWLIESRAGLAHQGP